MSRTQPRRLSWVILVLVLLAVVTVTLVVRSRRQGPGLPPCQGAGLPVRQPGYFDHYRQSWSEKVDGPGPGEAIVEIADSPADRTWQYHAETTTPSHQKIVEGRYRPGVVDEKVIEWSPPAEAVPFRHREVVVGREVWMDEPDGESWEYCTVDDWDVYAQKSLVFGYSADDPPGYAGCELSQCPFVIVPGSRVRVGPGTPSTVDGETLTTYEVRGTTSREFSTEFASLRATITVDDQRRLRAGKVWDANTGAVYFTLTAGPAPGNPPIVDPSNQPRLSTQPPPPPPTAGTVPVAPPP